MLAIAALATSFWACGDDPKPSTDAPDVTAPASVTDVLIEDEVELTFTVAAKGGYGSAAVSAVGGTSFTFCKLIPAPSSATTILISSLA